MDPPPEGMTLAEHWANLSLMRESARDELRREARAGAIEAALVGEDLGTDFLLVL